MTFARPVCRFSQGAVETQYFEYDAGGNLTAMLDAGGTSRFNYDALSRLMRRVTPRGDAVYYGYDQVSNLTKVQYPQGTAGAYYAYDALSRMSTLDSPTARRCYFAYDAAGNLAKRRLGNGVTAYYTYDNAERVAAIRHFAGSGGVAYFEFARDAAGRIMKLAREGNLAVYYGYDATDRLTAETWLKRSDSSQVYAFSYSYDAAGNRARMRREIRGSEFENAYYTVMTGIRYSTVKDPQGECRKQCDSSIRQGCYPSATRQNAGETDLKPFRDVFEAPT